MPELPDVEVFCRHLARVAVGKRVADVEVLEPRVARGPFSSLVSRRFSSVDRHGKYCFLGADDGRWVAAHFGMTGGVEFFQGEAPAHSALVFGFGDGGRLSFTSRRKLGRVVLIDDRSSFIGKKGLGPDALAVSRQEFLSLFGGRRGGVKSALLDQSLVAGVGNVYADEALYHAGVLPDRQVSEIGDKELGGLHREVVRVCRAAVRARARPDQMPPEFLIGRRKPGTPCGLCGGTIEKSSVAGRPTYFCGDHQS